MNHAYLFCLLLIVSLSGCVGYHAALRKEQCNERQLDIACTNLINAVKAMEKYGWTTNMLNEDSTRPNYPLRVTGTFSGGENGHDCGLTNLSISPTTK